MQFHPLGTGAFNLHSPEPSRSIYQHLQGQDHQRKSAATHPQALANSFTISETDNHKWPSTGLIQISGISSITSHHRHWFWRKQRLLSTDFHDAWNKHLWNLILKNNGESSCLISLPQSTKDKTIVPSKRTAKNRGNLSADFHASGLPTH